METPKTKMKFSSLGSTLMLLKYMGRGLRLLMRFQFSPPSVDLKMPPYSKLFGPCSSWTFSTWPPRPPDEGREVAPAPVRSARVRATVLDSSPDFILRSSLSPALWERINSTSSSYLSMDLPS